VEGQDRRRCGRRRSRRVTLPPVNASKVAIVRSHASMATLLALTAAQPVRSHRPEAVIIESGARASEMTLSHHSWRSRFGTVADDRRFGSKTDWARWVSRRISEHTPRGGAPATIYGRGRHQRYSPVECHSTGGGPVSTPAPTDIAHDLHDRDMSCSHAVHVTIPPIMAGLAVPRIC
jgi:hypothetical protein